MLQLVYKKKKINMSFIMWMNYNGRRIKAYPENFNQKKKY